MKNPIEVINKNIDSSFEKLTKEEIEKYIFLITQLRKTDVSRNIEYQSVYINFFKVNRLKVPLKKDYEKFIMEYFHLLEKSKNKKKKQLNPADIANQLYEVADKTIQFSFATKLCHVIHPDFFEIYDSKAMRALDLRQDKRGSTDVYVEKYSVIQSAYLEILGNEELVKLIKERFFRRFNVAADKISLLKMIDFILWKAGGEK